MRTLKLQKKLHTIIQTNYGLIVKHTVKMK